MRSVSGSALLLHPQTAVDIVHQDDRTVFHFIHNHIYRILGVSCLPVQGINAPQDQRCSRIDLHIAIVGSIRRTHQRRIVAGECTDLSICAFDLTLYGTAV